MDNQPNKNQEEIECKICPNKFQKSKGIQIRTGELVCSWKCHQIAEENLTSAAIIN